MVASPRAKSWFTPLTTLQLTSVPSESGPVLGPMTYGCAFWHPSSSDIPSDFNDSKQLSAEKRASLFQTIRTSKNIGFVLRVLHASEISRNMLRRSPYNLNAMSHDAAMEMIRAVLNAGVRIDTAYGKFRPARKA